MSAPKDYASAQTELEELLSSLQQPSVEIDSLTEKVARAKELLEWSKQKLRSTEAAIDQLLSEQQTFRTAFTELLEFLR